MITQWLEQTIIGLNLCPFAAKPYFHNELFIVDVPLTGEEVTLEDFLHAFESFRSREKASVALITFSKLETNFGDFYSFTQDCQDLLDAVGLGEEYQLVAFHPYFRFEGLAENDRANLVNSSPVPLINVLRSVDLELAGLSPEAGEELSHQNGKRLNQLSEDELMAHFPWRDQREL